MEDFLNDNLLWILLISLWSLVWKGLALWKAASKKDVVWFIVLLIVNTLGILEIFYVFVFSKDRPAKSDEK